MGKSYKRAYAKLKTGEKRKKKKKSTQNKIFTNDFIRGSIAFRSYTRPDRSGFECDTGWATQPASGKTSLVSLGGQIAQKGLGQIKKVSECPRPLFSRERKKEGDKAWRRKMERERRQGGERKKQANSQFGSNGISYWTESPTCRIVFQLKI